MNVFYKNFSLFLTATRAYSLPISVMSWSVPFIYGVLKRGNILFGLISLIGIITLHLATNIFDDVIDYVTEKNLIKKGVKANFNFQKGKCSCLFDGSLTLRQYFYITLLLFIIPFFIASFYIFIYGFSLLYILVPTVILCLLYPKLGSLGFGEIIVALIFSPLLYTGVFYSMTGSFSFDILLISISTGLFSVAVLHNHMLLDYKYDEENRKTTLCRLCKTQKNALLLLGLIILTAYINIIICVVLKELSCYFLITLFSVPTALTLYNVMTQHINEPDKKIKTNIFMGNLSDLKKVPEEQKNFLLKFLIVRNLLSLFTILIWFAIILTEIVPICI